MKHIIKFVIALLASIIYTVYSATYLIIYVLWNFELPAPPLLEAHELKHADAGIFNTPVFYSKVQWRWMLHDKYKTYDNFYHMLWGDRINEILKRLIQNGANALGRLKNIR